MADFSNFELMDIRENGVAHLADGLVPEMAEVFGVELSEQPTVDELGQLVGAVGQSKVLEDNIAQVQNVLGTEGTALEITSEWLDRSGVQKPLNRSLWTPDQAAEVNSSTFIVTGGMANWQDRVKKLLADGSIGLLDAAVYIPVGNREMKAPTEVVNPNVMAMHKAYDRYPTESEYAAAIVAPYLEVAGFDPKVVAYDTGNGDEIAARFVEEHNDLLADKLVFARVANAGLQLAVQFRTAARAIRPEFDADPENPQVFVLTDSFPIASTPEEDANPQEFQRPATGIRQVALTAKLLTQAAQQ